MQVRPPVSSGRGEASTAVDPTALTRWRPDGAPRWQIWGDVGSGDELLWLPSGRFGADALPAGGTVHSCPRRCVLDLAGCPRRCAAAASRPGGARFFASIVQVWRGSTC